MRERNSISLSGNTFSPLHLSRKGLDGDLYRTPHVSREYRIHYSLTSLLIFLLQKIIPYSKSRHYGVMGEDTGFLS